MKNKTNNGTKFFLIMLLVYIILGVYNKYLIIEATVKTINIFVKIIPILASVFLFVFLSNLFLTKDRISKHLGKESGLKGWIYSIIAGITVPAPPYIIFPLLGDLKKNGMKHSLIVSFLYNRNLQITFLPVAVFYFGFPYTAVMAFYIFVFSILSGLLVEKIVKS